MHHGNKLKGIIAQSGVHIKTIAARINKSRNTITNWCAMEKIPNENLILLGKSLRLDMREYFPHLRIDPDAEELSYFNEDPVEYFKGINKIKEEISEKISDKAQAIADKDFEIKMLKEKITDLKEIIVLKDDVILSLKEKILTLEEKLKNL
ncbi:MAG: hypothetical protein RIG77_03305 [Cyclobacteriaceae bacterium]